MDQKLCRRTINKIFDAITEGMFHPSMKGKMDTLEARKAELEADLRSAETEPSVLLHPGLPDHYREKAANLTDALNDPGTKTQASEMIGNLLSQIRLIPDDGTLAIELVGELAGLLSLGQTPAAMSIRAILYQWLWESAISVDEQG